jgi:hypothetical protein
MILSAQMLEDVVQILVGWMASQSTGAVMNLLKWGWLLFVSKARATSIEYNLLS